MITFAFEMQAIESVDTSAKHKVVDLFVLLILHSTANRKKAIESLIRNKIKNGHFTEEMLAAAFNSHSQVRLKNNNNNNNKKTIILCNEAVMSVH